MTNEEIFPSYVALWRRLPIEDLWVHYGPDLYGEVGAFQHDGQGGFKRPEIVIVRPHYIDEDEPSLERSDGKPVNLQAEMFTFAHEYGHYLSFIGGTTEEIWQEYHRAAVHRDELLNDMPAGDRIIETLAGGLSDREKDVIVAEERRAWELGRQFVPEALLDQYDDAARHGVHCHKYRLGLDPLWPEDKEFTAARPT